MVRWHGAMQGVWEARRELEKPMACRISCPAVAYILLKAAALVSIFPGQKFTLPATVRSYWSNRHAPA
jgi:hypothetical protein